MLSLPEPYVRFLDFRTLGDKPNRWGERTVERVRVRAELIAMRGGDDLLKVVAVF